MNFLKMLDIREFLDFSLKNSHPFLFLVVSKIYLKTEISLTVEALYRRPKITKSQVNFQIRIVSIITIDCESTNLSRAGVTANFRIEGPLMRAHNILFRALACLLSNIERAQSAYCSCSQRE